MTSALISGASIAGPALAYWLDRYGFDVTVVENADTVRPGGQPVDLKGRTHLTVLRRMGVLDEARAAQVGTADGAIVDGRGRRIGTVPGAFSGGDLNIPRGDLARILHRRTQDTCEYVFGDTITSLSQVGSEAAAGGVDVTFAHADRRRFDLVVGADGIHSTVRRLAFGPESDYVTHLGYYYSQFTAPGGQDELYNEPGRMAATGRGSDPAFLVWASPQLAYDRDDVAGQRRLVRAAYRGAGWRVPELLDQMDAAPYFWFDTISRVAVDSYSRGRVALVGDAAYGNALGGFGTGLALVGAYVLAGELARSPHDPAVAFDTYHAKFHTYARVSRRVNAGRILAPRTRPAIWLRNRLFTVAGLFAPLMGLSDRFANDIDLEDYPATLHPHPA